MRNFFSLLLLVMSATLFSQEDCQNILTVPELSEQVQVWQVAHDGVQVQSVTRLSDGFYQVELSNGNTFIQRHGCTDPAFTEYNASANTDDGSCATPVVSGCTDPAFTEYNASANTDDGSCATAVVQGCMNEAYLEYNSNANTDNGSCATLIVYGCTNSNFTEYSSSANTDNGSCATPVVLGCTNAAYLEYNADANTNNGSCTTLIVNGCTDSDYMEYNPSANVDDSSCATLVVYGCLDSDDGNYNPQANTDDGSCFWQCIDVEMDGYTYAVVEIGNQCWFAENLRTTVFADGTPIPTTTDNGAWASATGPMQSYYIHTGDPSLNNYWGPDNPALELFGRLYNGWAYTSQSGLCPSGWHVPSNEDWNALSASVGGSASNLKQCATWDDPNSWSYSNWCSNSSGWSAAAGGSRNGTSGVAWLYGYSNGVGTRGYWASTSDANISWGDYLSNRWILYYADDINQSHSSYKEGLSVRCVKVQGAE